MLQDHVFSLCSGHLAPIATHRVQRAGPLGRFPAVPGTLEAPSRHNGISGAASRSASGGAGGGAGGATDNDGAGASAVGCSFAHGACEG